MRFVLRNIFAKGAAGTSTNILSRIAANLNPHHLPSAPKFFSSGRSQIETCGCKHMTRLPHNMVSILHPQPAQMLSRSLHVSQGESK